MKSRMLLSAAIIAVAAVALAALYAGAQPPPLGPLPVTGTTTGTVVVQNADGTVVEQTADGKILRTTIARQPQGPNFFPMTSADGKTVYAYASASATDPEALQMLTAEQSAAQEAKTLAAQYAQADSDQTRKEAKAKLREKLIAVFELQQKRRAHEIAKIEERLGKLKETMKKRDASQDPIVDRRLDQLTGGVDELGWEETGPHAVPGYSVPPYGAPAPVLPPVSRLPAGSTLAPPELPALGPQR